MIDPSNISHLAREHSAQIKAGHALGPDKASAAAAAAGPHVWRGRAPFVPSNIRIGGPLAEGENWRIHRLFLRRNFAECLKRIEVILKQSRGQNEFAVFTKALIRREEGKIQESLELFQAAVCLNPHNVQNVKQVGRSLYLLGRHRQALNLFEEASKLTTDDWEIPHFQGLCCMYLKEYDRAVGFYRRANIIQRHDCTFLQLGKVYTLQQEFDKALEVYEEAIEYSPENPEMLTTMGLLHLQLGETYKAFDYLGNALTHDPKNTRAILAAGSIIQDHHDYDVALVKYRVAAVTEPDSPRLLNNIGMCFFGKRQYLAAISCLKCATRLDPFEWIILYNLGLVHLNTEQYASAFHYLSAAINLKDDFAGAYLYLAVALSRLDDFANSRAAYEKALELNADHITRLNFAITLFNNGERKLAKEHFTHSMRLWREMDTEARAVDPDVAPVVKALCNEFSMTFEDM